ncbi:ADP-ribose pyrophosphatase YjhB (NUDIX family) [Clostridium beijerinckii]|uniref:NUDIX hydrolase n=1 Tax=Clostridium beijerinckii TaxID=1520 RepID=UPI00157117B2|nr:NUDIX hydrolase [Clostridium beijerinckii]NRT35892.1 ADP-ribose pyrophosphatase YjhB (NUDIX family) [Clostridium beijerinckii]NRT44681.1 ADP-ribose pyrophosphatase YjhB (NUDIX family) [Clostridium beijerinckii]NRZ21327.1 ADP-ribose pyrophosphatase YjhB (NUDIX family) [Clostridium beijerinckii]
MEEQDLTFKTNGVKFNYRVGAIIIRDKKLLMVKNDSAPYYYSVGGRVKLNETSEEAVIRETFEETGVELEIDRLAFIHEHFFNEEITNENYHEIAFFYLMKVSTNMKFVCKSFGDQGPGAKEHLHWLPIDELDSHHLYPEFFKTKLSRGIKDIEHIISKE